MGSLSQAWGRSYMSRDSLCFHLVASSERALFGRIVQATTQMPCNNAVKAKSFQAVSQPSEQRHSPVVLSAADFQRLRRAAFLSSILIVLKALRASFPNIDNQNQEPSSLCREDPTTRDNVHQPLSTSVPRLSSTSPPTGMATEVLAPEASSCATSSVRDSRMPEPKRGWRRSSRLGVLLLGHRGAAPRGLVKVTNRLEIEARGLTVVLQVGQTLLLGEDAVLLRTALLTYLVVTLDAAPLLLSMIHTHLLL